MLYDSIKAGDHVWMANMEENNAAFPMFVGKELVIARARRHIAYCHALGDEEGWWIALSRLTSTPNGSYPVEDITRT